jgi:hypothetical protein
MAGDGQASPGQCPGLTLCNEWLHIARQNIWCEETRMTISDLPAIMGAVLTVVGILMVVVSAWRKNQNSIQAGALLVVVGAVLLGLSLFFPHAK